MLLPHACRGAVLKVVQVSRNSLQEVRNLKQGKKKGLNFSSNDVKWHPQHGMDTRCRLACNRCQALTPHVNASLQGHIRERCNQRRRYYLELGTAALFARCDTAVVWPFVWWV